MISIGARDDARNDRVDHAAKIASGMHIRLSVAGQPRRSRLNRRRADHAEAIFAEGRARRLIRTIRFALPSDQKSPVSVGM
jgi:hypothetical protein